MEAELLDELYNTQLYGGPTMNDSIADGARDDSSGALFRAAGHAQLLFRTTDCLRAEQAGCMSETSPW